MIIVSQHSFFILTSCVVVFWVVVAESEITTNPCARLHGCVSVDACSQLSWLVGFVPSLIFFLTASSITDSNGFLRIHRERNSDSVYIFIFISKPMKSHAHHLTRYLFFFFHIFVVFLLLPVVFACSFFGILRNNNQKDDAQTAFYIKFIHAIPMITMCIWLVLYEWFSQMTSLS